MEYTRIQPTTLLAPLPCAMVSCRGEEGRPNILTVAWSGVVNTHPPMVSISVKPERFSHDLIAGTREFCLHPADRAHARELDLCGVISGRDHDKFLETGLREMDAGLSHAPGLDGLPVCLACRVRDVLSLGSHDLFLAEVQSVFVRNDLMDSQGGIHLERAELIAYSHGLYHELGSILGFFGFSLARPETFRRRMRSYQKRGQPSS